MMDGEYIYGQKKTSLRKKIRRVFLLFIASLSLTLAGLISVVILSFCAQFL